MYDIYLKNRLDIQYTQWSFYVNVVGVTMFIDFPISFSTTKYTVIATNLDGSAATPDNERKIYPVGWTDMGRQTYGVKLVQSSGIGNSLVSYVVIGK